MAYTGIGTGTHTGDSNLAANAKPSIEQAIAMLRPYQTPVLQWTHFSNRPMVEVRNKYGKHSWFENEFYPHIVNVSSSITGGSTLTITSSNVDNPTYLQLDDTVLIEATNEWGYVSSITAGSGSDRTITPFSGSFTAVPSGIIKIIGNVRIEVNTTPTYKYTQEVEKYNYNQIFTESVDMSGRDMSGDAWTDMDTINERLELQIEQLKLKIERAFLHNLASFRIGSGSTVRSGTQGLLGRITTNVTSYTGGLTEEDLDNHFKTVFAKGSNVKYHYCGSDQLADINKIVKAKQMIWEAVPTKYGVKVFSYMTPFGDVKLVWNPILDGTVYAKYGITIDESKVKGMYQAAEKGGQARKFRIERDVQTPGNDQKTHKILADVGIMVQNEETCGVLKGA